MSNLYNKDVYNSSWIIYIYIYKLSTIQPFQYNIEQI